MSQNFQGVYLINGYLITKVCMKRIYSKSYIWCSSLINEILHLGTFNGQIKVIELKNTWYEVFLVLADFWLQLQGEK